MDSMPVKPVASLGFGAAPLPLSGAAANLAGVRPSRTCPPASQEGFFSWPVRVYWEDTDAGGIVFYANYLKFFERSRTEWLRSLGLEQQRLRQSTGGIFVVSESRLRYHRPARLDDELIVTAKMLEKGRASLIIGQSALLKTEQSSFSTLLCEGTIRIGWVDALSLKPARIPTQILDRLENPS